jgi:hypothetical protein
MTLSDWILTLNALAVLLAPVVALRIAGVFQRRSDAHKAKLDIFATLIGLRHDPQSVESVRALNTIDVVFADNPDVRDAWTRYIATLNDPTLNDGAGFAIRDDKRRELLLEIVKALGLQRKVSSADLLRAYMPTFAFESVQLAVLERTYKRALYEEYLKKQNIPLPLGTGPLAATTTSPPAGGNSGAAARTDVISTMPTTGHASQG